LTGIPPLPPPPSTLPLDARQPSGHVSPMFALLSGVGVGLVILIMATQFFLTRAGRRRRWTL
jgi:hypothetical protein